MLNYYQILKIEENATSKKIQKQYRKLAQKYHPDVSSEKNAKEKFQKVTEAYEVLSDAQMRKKYDRKLNEYRNKKKKKSKKKSTRKKKGRTPFNPKEFKNQYKKSFRQFFGFDPDTKEKVDQDNKKEQEEDINTDDLFNSFFNPKNNK